MGAGSFSLKQALVLLGALLLLKLPASLVLIAKGVEFQAKEFGLYSSCRGSPGRPLGRRTTNRQSSAQEGDSAGGAGAGVLKAGQPDSCLSALINRLEGR